MARFDFIGSNGVLITSSDIIVNSYNDTTGRTFSDVVNQFKNDLEITGNSQASYNGDDSSWHFDMHAPLQLKIPMLAKMAFSSEGGFGFFNNNPSSSSNNPGLKKSRMYVPRNPRPALFFTYGGINVDHKSYNTEFYKNSKGTIIAGYHSNYNNTSNQFWFVIKITTNKINCYFRNVSLSTNKMYAVTFDQTGASDNKVNEYEIGTMFDNGYNTTEVTINFINQFKTSGQWTSKPYALTPIKNLLRTFIDWDEDKPDGTYIDVQTAVSSSTSIPSDDQFVNVTKGGQIPNLTQGTDYSDKYLFIRVKLRTDDPTKAPAIFNLKFEVENFIEQKFVQLVFDPVYRFRNAIGPIRVEYDQNLGTIYGEGGSVQSFSQEFMPTDLDPSPLIHHKSRLKSNFITSNINYMQIFYKDQKYNERDKMKANVSDVSIVFTKASDIGV